MFLEDVSYLMTIYLSHFYEDIEFNKKLPCYSVIPRSWYGLSKKEIADMDSFFTDFSNSVCELSPEKMDYLWSLIPSMTDSNYPFSNQYHFLRYYSEHKFQEECSWDVYKEFKLAIIHDYLISYIRENSTGYFDKYLNWYST